jgi:hypothetical protein
MRREGEEEEGVKKGEEGVGEEEEEGAGREDGETRREDIGSREGLWTMWRSREVKALVTAGWMLQAWLKAGRRVPGESEVPAVRPGMGLRCLPSPSLPVCTVPRSPPPPPPPTSPP